MGLFFYTKKGSIISTVDLPTTEIIEPFFDVQSDENAFFKVFKVPKAIGIPHDNLDQIVSSFEFGIRVRFEKPSERLDARA